MKIKKYSMQVTWAILIAVLLVGCSTPTASLTPLPEMPYEVTLEGDECVYSGPTELPVGEYEIIFKNKGELSGGEVYVFYLRDGHTHQDLVNVQSEPGEYFERDWTVYSMKDYVGWDEDNNNIYNFHLNDVGDYSIVVNYEAEQKNIWLCSPLTVIETTSE